MRAGLNETQGEGGSGVTVIDMHHGHEHSVAFETLIVPNLCATVSGNLHGQDDTSPVHAICRAVIRGCTHNLAQWDELVVLQTK